MNMSTRTATFWGALVQPISRGHSAHCDAAYMASADVDLAHGRRRVRETLPRSARFGPLGRLDALGQRLSACRERALAVLLLRVATVHTWRSAIVGRRYLRCIPCTSNRWPGSPKERTCSVGCSACWRCWHTSGTLGRRASRAGCALPVTLALGLMCKPILVMWPMLFLVLDFWPLARYAGGAHVQRVVEQKVGDGGIPTVPASMLFLEKLTFLPLVAASAVVTFVSQRSSGAVASLESVRLSERVARAAEVYVAYIGKTFWPVDLAPLYPVRPLASYSLAVAAGATLLLISACAAWFARRSPTMTAPWLAAGWLWYLVTLIPNIGLVQVGSQVMADRFLYLPQIGLCLGLAWLLADIVGPSVARHVAASAAGLLIVVTLAAFAARQTSFWRDDLTLWTRTVNCTADNYIAHLHLGLAWAARGENEKAAAAVSKGAPGISPVCRGAFRSCLCARCARPDRRRPAALRVGSCARPKYAKARNNLGMLLFNRGDFAAAAEQFQKALEVDPD